MLPHWRRTTRRGATPPRTAASPPVNGGNCTIRGATRRRHADRTLLILQNPPSSPGCGGVAEVNCVPESPASQNIWAIMPMPAIVRRGGLHCGRRCPEAWPRRQQAGGVVLHGDPCVTCLPVTSPPNGGSCASRGPVRDVPAGDISIKRGELHH